MNNDLLTNIDKIHTTKLGAERIRKNLGLDITDIIAWCKWKIENAEDIINEAHKLYKHFFYFQNKDHLLTCISLNDILY